MTGTDTPSAEQNTSPPADPRLLAVSDEMWHLLYAIRDLDVLLVNPGILPAWTVATMRQRYMNRYAQCHGEREVLLGRASAPATATTPAPAPLGATMPAAWNAPHAMPYAAAPPAPARSSPWQPGAPPAPREPWLRPFVTENAILILSSLGGFLLVIATLLFETYGPDVGGSGHLAGIVVLDAIFGLAAWFCLRRPLLRIVGETYTAVVALLTPLTMVAAHRFLGLESHGISAATAATAGAVACGVLYGVLGIKLASAAYAALAEVAVLVAWVSLVNAAGGGSHAAAWCAPMGALWALVALGPWHLLDTGRRFAAPANALRHVVAAGALVASLWFAADDSYLQSAQLSLTMGLVGLTFVVAAVLGHRTEDRAVAALCLTTAVVLATQAAHLGGEGAASACAVMGLVYAASAYRLAGNARDAALSAAIVLGIAAGGPGIDRPPLRIAILLTTVVTCALVAVRRRQSGWTLFALVAIGLQCARVPGTEVVPFDGLAVVLTGLAATMAAVGCRLRQSVIAAWVALVAGGAVLSGAMQAGAGDRELSACWLALALLVAVSVLLLRAPPPVLNAMRVIAASELVLAAAMHLDQEPVRIAVLVAVVVIALVLALGSGEPLWLLTGLVALGAQLLTLSEQLDGVPGVPRYLFLPITLAALASATAIVGVHQRRPVLALVFNAGISATALAMSFSYGGDAGVYATVLIVLGAVGVAAAWVAREQEFGTRARRALVVGAALRLVIATALPVSPDGRRMTILLCATALTVAIAVIDIEPLWLLFAGATFSGAWYLGVPLVIETPSGAGLSGLALLLTPLVPLSVATGLAMRALITAGQRTRWVQPMYWLAAALAASILMIGLSGETLAVASSDLIGFALLLYLVGIVEGWPQVVPLTGAGVAAGLLGLGLDVRAGAPVSAVVIAVWAWVIYVVHARRSAAAGWRGWARAHRWTGIAVAGLAAVACTSGMGYFEVHATGALTSFLATLSLGAMLAIDGMLHRVPILEYVAAFTASLALLWLVSYASPPGAAVVYPSIPATSLLAAGLTLRRDRRLTVTPEVLRAVLGAGALVLLTASALPAYGGSDAPAAYTALLLVESVALVLLGIGERLRILVIVGSSGAALAALRSLYSAVQNVPLWAVFGLTALVLLAVSAWLAVNRHRVATTRELIRAEWAHWS